MNTTIGGLRGADVEIWEEPSVNTPDGERWIPLKPRRIKVNGVELLTPDDAPVKVDGLVDPKNCATMTVTFFLNSLTVRDA